MTATLRFKDEWVLDPRRDSVSRPRPRAIFATRTKRRKLVRRSPGTSPFAPTSGSTRRCSNGSSRSSGWGQMPSKSIRKRLPSSRTASATPSLRPSRQTFLAPTRGGYTRGGKSDIYIRADALDEHAGPSNAFVCEAKWANGKAVIVHAIERTNCCYAIARCVSRRRSCGLFAARTSRQRRSQCSTGRVGARMGRNQTGSSWMAAAAVHAGRVHGYDRSRNDRASRSQGVRCWTCSQEGRQVTPAEWNVQ